MLAPSTVKTHIFTACAEIYQTFFPNHGWVIIQGLASVHCLRGEKLICVIMMTCSYINIFSPFNGIQFSF